MLTDLRKEISRSIRELALWKNIATSYYQERQKGYVVNDRVGGAYAYISEYEYIRLVDLSVFTRGLDQWKHDYKIPILFIENKIKQLKHTIANLNRIISYINRVNEITEDRNYWRLKCKIHIGETHLYPEFIRLQNERREKRLPI